MFSQFHQNYLALTILPKLQNSKQEKSLRT